MISRSLALGFAAGFVVLALAVALFATRRPPPAIAVAMHGTPLSPPKTALDFVLLDGGARPTHLLDRADAVTLLFFGYTHCPDACPLALASLARAYRSLDAERRLRTRIVFVTVDPKRDRPPVMRAYAAKFDPHIVALTGPAADLARVWRAYGVRVDPSSHEVGHDDTIYAIDADARVTYVYPPDSSASDLASDLRVLAR